MATNIDEKPYDVDNLSGGIQRKSTKFQSADGEVALAVNADFERVGGVQKTSGYSLLGTEVSSTTSTSTSTSSSTSTSTSTSSTTTS